MRCELCGCELTKGEGIQETRSEQVKPPSRYGGNTRTVPVMLCPTCARKRGGMLWVVVGFLALVVAGMLAVGLLSGPGR